MEKVLVTGGSGFIALHCIVENDFIIFINDFFNIITLMSGNNNYFINLLTCIFFTPKILKTLIKSYPTLARSFRPSHLKFSPYS